MKHFVPAAGIEIVSDRRNTRAAIAVCERAYSIELLSDGVVAAGENVYGKIRSHFPDLSRIAGTPVPLVRIGNAAAFFATQDVETTFRVRCLSWLRPRSWLGRIGRIINGSC